MYGIIVYYVQLLFKLFSGFVLLGTIVTQLLYLNSAPHGIIEMEVRF